MCVELTLNYGDDPAISFYLCLSHSPLWTGTTTTSDKSIHYISNLLFIRFQMQILFKQSSGLGLRPRTASRHRNPGYPSSPSPVSALEWTEVDWLSRRP
jgi:hypothetical protein